MNGPSSPWASMMRSTASTPSARTSSSSRSVVADVEAELPPCRRASDRRPLRRARARAEGVAPPRRRRDREPQVEPSGPEPLEVGADRVRAADRHDRRRPRLRGLDRDAAPALSSARWSLIPSTSTTTRALTLSAVHLAKRRVEEPVARRRASKEHADREERRGDPDPATTTPPSSTPSGIAAHAPARTAPKTRPRRCARHDLGQDREEERVDRPCREPGDRERDERDRERRQRRQRRGSRSGTTAKQVTERASPREPMADRAVAERARERRAAEDAVHEAEIGRAPVLLAREDGQRRPETAPRAGS